MSKYKSKKSIFKYFIQFMFFFRKIADKQVVLPEPQPEMTYMEEFFPMEPVESKYCYCNRVF